MKGIRQDLRYALRVLIKNPAFSAVAIITLALGIGVNATVFSIVNTYLFKPLPVDKPNELVAVAQKVENFQFPNQVTYPDYREVAKLDQVFSGALGADNEFGNVSFNGRQPERIQTDMVTAGFFSVLGLRPSAGRLFVPEEEKEPGGAPVMVLSYKYWQKAFGGSPSAIGETVKLNGKAFRIVGVAPEEFVGTFALMSPDAYIPLGARGLLFEGGDHMFTSRGDGAMRVLARLKPGVTIEQARAALDVLSGRLAQEFPATNKGSSFMVVPETRSRPVMEISSTFNQVSLIFMALVGLVLVIACANVANLMLARATSRQKELAIRSALGASRSSIIRLFLTETLMLSAGGGILGLLLGYWAAGFMSNLRFSMDVPIHFTFSIDFRVFAFTAVAVIAATILSGLLPAIRASKPDINDTLKEGGRGNSGDGGWQKVRSALVAAQVAVSLFLLIAGALFVRSMQKAQNANLGFRTDNILMGEVDLSLQGYDKAKGQLFYKQIIDRVKQIPGVKSATLAHSIPFGSNNSAMSVFTEDQVSRPDNEVPFAFYNEVDPQYFDTMGVSIVEGRKFTERDNESAPKVAIVSKAMAATMWPGQDPLGKRFKTGRNGDFVQVVGVTGDEKHIFVSEDPRPFMYLPLAQSYDPQIAVELYTEGNPSSFAAGLTQAVHDIDPDLPVYGLETLQYHLQNGLALFFVRAGAVFAGIFGLLALVLASVGLYGVIAYSVSRRKHEIGIRMALGAARGQVLVMVFRQGFTVVLIGLAIGLGLAFLAARSLSSLLYGVSALDPATLITVAVSLLAIAALAIYIPALRAARTSPMTALRYE